MERLIEDTQHWQNLQPPLAPNEYEVEIYRHHVRGMGAVCLLGMTKSLIPLCDYMVDLNPIQQEKPVVKTDWAELKVRPNVILGDGVLNLSGQELVEKLLAVSDKVVCRVFLRKLEGMKYAQHFPTEFPGADMVIPTQKDVVIVVWTRTAFGRTR
jgi:hypothetical protein